MVITSNNIKEFLNFLLVKYGKIYMKQKMIFWKKTNKILVHYSVMTKTILKNVIHSTSDLSNHYSVCH